MFLLSLNTRCFWKFLWDIHNVQKTSERYYFKGTILTQMLWKSNKKKRKRNKKNRKEKKSEKIESKEKRSAQSQNNHPSCLIKYLSVGLYSRFLFRTFNVFFFQLCIKRKKKKEKKNISLQHKKIKYYVCWLGFVKFEQKEKK